MSELRECPEVMDNNGDKWERPVLEPCPCGGTPGIRFIGNHCHKKQVAKIYCTTAGCFFEQRVGVLRSGHTMGWALEKCAAKWNHRPTEQRLQQRVRELEGKSERNGIRIALDVIKKLQRWNLCWEWMEEAANGDYIKIEDAQNALINILAQHGEGE